MQEMVPYEIALDPLRNSICRIPLMKRYRWTNFFIDTTRNILRNPNVPDEIKEQEKKQLYEMVGHRYGFDNVESKFERWFELEPPPLCVPVEYHELLREVEGAYVRGDFYPTLTGACCLGERILNHLVMGLKEYHRESPHYSKVARKQSIQDWEKAISILYDWQVVNEDTAKGFHDLFDLRNPAVHFGEVQDRALRAQTAVCLIYTLTKRLFGMDIPQFFMAPGEIYLRQSYESDPFTKEFILPHCNKVGYRHSVETRDGQMTILDSDSYYDRPITDDEFVEFREAWRRGIDKGANAG